MRHADWQSRLAELVAERMDAPFEWGGHDCCLFAADAVLALTGIDPAAALRGTYDSEFGAARLLGALGGVAAIAAAHCGPEVPPALARPGDVVLLALERDTLGVCTGATWHAPADRGLACGPMVQAARAWKVG